MSDPSPRPRTALQNMLIGTGTLMVVFGAMGAGVGLLHGHQQDTQAHEINSARILLSGKLNQITGKTMQEAQPAITALQQNRFVTTWMRNCLNSSAENKAAFNGNSYQMYVIDAQKYGRCLTNYAAAPAAEAAFSRGQGAAGGFALCAGTSMMYPFIVWMVSGRRRLLDPWRNGHKKNPADAARPA